MLSCPLCKSEKYYTLRSFEVNTLKDMWMGQFRFNPFPDEFKSREIRKLKCTECDIVFYNPTYLGDSDFYEKISENKWYYETDKWEFDETIKLISKFKPKSVLEIGCGDGAFLDKIASAVDAEGIEINEDAIKKCTSKGLRVTNTKLADITKKFDLIVSFQVFEHLDNAASYIEESLNCLNKDGLLLVSVPNPEGYFKELDIVLLDLPPHHNLSYSHKTFEFISKKYNLNLIQYAQEPLRYVHYQLFMNSILNYDNGLHRHSLRDRIRNKMKAVFFQFLSPSSFISDREKIIGQTHFAVFQKN